VIALTEAATLYVDKETAVFARITLDLSTYSSLTFSTSRKSTTELLNAAPQTASLALHPTIGAKGFEPPRKYRKP
jgi:hypothetical protein